jgi:hypothetical protein
MNKLITGADLVVPKVTTGALPASRKVYSQPEARPAGAAARDRANMACLNFKSSNVCYPDIDRRGDGAMRAERALAIAAEKLLH